MKNNRTNMKKAIDLFYKRFNKWEIIYKIEFWQSGPGFVEYLITYSNETANKNCLAYEAFIRVEKVK